MSIILQLLDEFKNIKECQILAENLTLGVLNHYSSPLEPSQFYDLSIVFPQLSVPHSTSAIYAVTSLLKLQFSEITEETYFLKVSKALVHLVSTILNFFVDKCCSSTFNTQETVFLNSIEIALNIFIPLREKSTDLGFTFMKNCCPQILTLITSERLSFSVRRSAVLLFAKEVAECDQKILKRVTQTQQNLLRLLVLWIPHCGDIHLQESLLEIAVYHSATSPEKIALIKKWFSTAEYETAVDSLSFNNLSSSCRVCLNYINSLTKPKKVFTLACLRCFGDRNVPLVKPKDEYYKEFWVDFNTSTKCISFIHLQDSSELSLQRLVIYFNSILSISGCCSNSLTKEDVEEYKLVVTLKEKLPVVTAGIACDLSTLSFIFIAGNKIEELINEFLCIHFSNLHYPSTMSGFKTQDLAKTGKKIMPSKTNYSVSKEYFSRHSTPKLLGRKSYETQGLLKKYLNHSSDDGKSSKARKLSTCQQNEKIKGSDCSDSELSDIRLATQLKKQFNTSNSFVTEYAKIKSNSYRNNTSLKDCWKSDSSLFKGFNDSSIIARRRSGDASSSFSFPDDDLEKDEPLKVARKSNETLDKIDTSIKPDSSSADEDYNLELRSAPAKEMSPVEFGELSVPNFKSSEKNDLPSLFKYQNCEDDFDCLCPQMPDISAIKRFSEQLENQFLSECESGDSIVESPPLTNTRTKQLFQRVSNYGRSCSEKSGISSNKTSPLTQYNSEEELKDMNGCRATHLKRSKKASSDSVNSLLIVPSDKDAHAKKINPCNALKISEVTASKLLPRKDLDKTEIKSSSDKGTLKPSVLIDVLSSSDEEIISENAPEKSQVGVKQFAQNQPVVKLVKLMSPYGKEEHPSKFLQQETFRSSDKESFWNNAPKTKHGSKKGINYSSSSEINCQRTLDECEVRPVKKTDNLGKDIVKSVSPRYSNPSCSDVELKTSKDISKEKPSYKHKTFKENSHTNRSSENALEDSKSVKRPNQITAVQPLTRGFKIKETSEDKAQTVQQFSQSENSAFKPASTHLKTSFINRRSLDINKTEEMERHLLSEDVRYSHRKPIEAKICNPQNLELLKASSNIPLNKATFKPICRDLSPQVRLSKVPSSMRSTDASSKMELEQIFQQSLVKSTNNSFKPDNKFTACKATPFAPQMSNSFVRTSAKIVPTSFVDKNDELCPENSFNFNNSRDAVNTKDKVSTNASVENSAVPRTQDSDSSMFFSPYVESSQGLNFTKLVNSDANNNTLPEKKNLKKDSSPAMLVFSKPAKTYVKKCQGKPNHTWFQTSDKNKNRRNNSNKATKGPVKKKLFYLPSSYQGSFSSNDSQPKPPIAQSKPKKFFKSDNINPTIFEILESDGENAEQSRPSFEMKKSTEKERVDDLRRSTRNKKKVNYTEISDTEKEGIFSASPKAEIHSKENEKDIIKNIILNCVKEKVKSLSKSDSKSVQDPKLSIKESKNDFVDKIKVESRRNTNCNLKRNAKWNNSQGKNFDSTYSNKNSGASSTRQNLKTIYSPSTVSNDDCIISSFSAFKRSKKLKADVPLKKIKINEKPFETDELNNGRDEMVSRLNPNTDRPSPAASLVMKTEEVKADIHHRSRSSLVKAIKTNIIHEDDRTDEILNNQSTSRNGDNTESNSATFKREDMKVNISNEVNNVGVLSLINVIQEDTEKINSNILNSIKSFQNGLRNVSNNLCKLSDMLRKSGSKTAP